MPHDPASTLAGRSLGAGVLLGRRGSPANGRAVLGGFLVAAAAALVFAVTLGGHGHRSAQYAVATRPLAAGTVIAPGDTVAAKAQLPRGSAALAFSDPDQLVGRSVQTAIEPGELVEAPMLVPAGAAPALRPVTISVDPGSVRALRAGDQVDALSVPTSTSGSSAPGVAVVVRGASLMAVDAPSSSVGASPSALATLGVARLADVEALVGASRSGQVVLVKAEPSDSTTSVAPGTGRAG